MKPAKIAFVLICGICAAYTALAASPAATQAWVQRYVADALRDSIVTPTYIPPTVLHGEVDGTNFTLRIRIDVPTNDALMVWSATSNSLLATGEVFACTAPGLYENYTNSACDHVELSCRRLFDSYSDDWRYDVSTNGGNVVTNVIASATNYLDWTVADLSVGGVALRGFSRDCWFRCVAYADPSNDLEVVLLRTRVTNRTRRAVLTPPPTSLSWLDLIFPSARASEWRLASPPTLVKEDDDYKYYEAHYLLDGVGTGPSIGEYELTLETGAEIVFDLSGTPALSPVTPLPFDGTDACDFKKPSVDSGLMDSLISLLGDSIKPEKYQKLSKNILLKYGDKIKYDLTKTINDWLNTIPGPPTPCPKEWKEEKPKKEEPPAPDPDPTPTPGGGCDHSQYGATGHCGAWRCANCGATLSGGPSSHNFVEAEGDCQKCMNKFKNAVCRASDTNPYHHFYGKDCGGDENGCICKHGGFTIPHPGFAIADDGRWQSTAAVHWQMEECTRCPFRRQTNKGPHGSAEGKWEDTGNGTCVFVQKCPTCSYEFSSGTPSPHMPGEPNGNITDEGSAGHAIHKDCSRCPAKDVGSEVLPHTYANDDAADATWTDNGDNHKRLKTCDFPGCGHTEPETAPHSPGAPSGEPQDCDRACRHPKERHNGHAQKLTCAAKGCGHDMGLGTPVPHEWTYELSNAATRQDTRKCEACGHTDAVDHEWTFDSSIHYCTQGGQMHLYGLHEGDPCSCGWSAGYHIEKVVFSCGGCFREIVVDSNGDPVPGATEHINCDYYGSGSDNCACPMCTVGLYSLCWCCFRIGDGKVEWRMQSTSGSGADPAYMTNSLAKSFVGSVSTENNADCRKVADNYFAGGFDGFAALESADFQYATNAGEYAFAGAFSNCAALASVRFDRLQTADFYAFAGAFQGCPNLGALVFPSLDSISYWTFLGCGATNYVFSAVTNIEDLALQGISGRMSFPSLRTTCAHAFAGCTAALDLPGLKTVREFGFAEYGHGDLRLPAVTNFVHADGAFDSSSVTNLHLPRVTTNALLSAMEDAFAPSLLYPSFGLRSGCRVHCSDGIIVVP